MVNRYRKGVNFGDHKSQQRNRTELHRTTPPFLLLYTTVEPPHTHPFSLCLCEFVSFLRYTSLKVFPPEREREGARHREKCH